MALYNSDAKRDFVQRALLQPPDLRTPQQIGVLQRLTSTISAFSTMPRQALAQLCRSMTLKCARKNAIIIREGDTADCMYVPFLRTTSALYLAG